MMAITISVGFVVDDAIVVIENMFRFIETRRKANSGGAQRSPADWFHRHLHEHLARGGVYSVAVHERIDRALVPRICRHVEPGDPGFRVISLTLTPMLCGRFLKQEEKNRNRGAFDRLSEQSFDAMHRFYERSLKWVLDHEYLMLLATLGVIVATIWFYFVVSWGLFPQQDTGQMMGTTEAAQDIHSKR